MKVILLKDVPKQGKKDQVLEVSDGYGHNYLLKNNLAVLANESNLAKLERDLSTRKVNEEELVLKMQELKDLLEKEKLIFKAKVGKDDKMFGSVSSKHITEALKDKNYDIRKEQIEIDNPISSLGSHIIKLSLHKKVVAELTIVVEK